MSTELTETDRDYLHVEILAVGEPTLEFTLEPGQVLTAGRYLLKDDVVALLRDPRHHYAAAFGQPVTDASLVSHVHLPDQPNDVPGRDAGSFALSSLAFVVGYDRGRWVVLNPTSGTDFRLRGWGEDFTAVRANGGQERIHYDQTRFAIWLRTNYLRPDGTPRKHLIKFTRSRSQDRPRAASTGTLRLSRQWTEDEKALLCLYFRQYLEWEHPIEQPRFEAKDKVWKRVFDDMPDDIKARFGLDRRGVDLRVLAQLWFPTWRRGEAVPEDERYLLSAGASVSGSALAHLLTLQSAINDHHLSFEEAEEHLKALRSARQTYVKTVVAAVVKRYLTGFDADIASNERWWAETDDYRSEFTAKLAGQLRFALLNREVPAAKAPADSDEPLETTNALDTPFDGISLRELQALLLAGNTTLPEPYRFEDDLYGDLRLRAAPIEDLAPARARAASR